MLFTFIVAGAVAAMIVNAGVIPRFVDDSIVRNGLDLR